MDGSVDEAMEQLSMNRASAFPTTNEVTIENGRLAGAESNNDDRSDDGYSGIGKKGVKRGGRDKRKNTGRGGRKGKHKAGDNEDLAQTSEISMANRTTGSRGKGNCADRFCIYGQVGSPAIPVV